MSTCTFIRNNLHPLYPPPFPPPSSLHQRPNCVSRFSTQIRLRPSSPQSAKRRRYNPAHGHRQVGRQSETVASTRHSNCVADEVSPCYSDVAFARRSTASCSPCQVAATLHPALCSAPGRSSERKNSSPVRTCCPAVD